MVFIHLKDKNEKKVIINCFFIRSWYYQIGKWFLYLRDMYNGSGNGQPVTDGRSVSWRYIRKKFVFEYFPIVSIIYTDAAMMQRIHTARTVLIRVNQRKQDFVELESLDDVFPY